MVADHLSRNYLNETTEKLVDEFSVNALSYLPITPWKYVKLQKAAAADLEMMLLRKLFLKDGTIEEMNFQTKFVYIGITEMSLRA